MVRPRIAIVSPTVAVFQKFQKNIDMKTCFPFAMDDTNTNIDEDNVVEKVNARLESFAFDVVLVAPIYADLFKSFTLPSSWTNTTFADRPKPTVDEVLLFAKPVDSLKAIREKSWIGKIPFWQLDGV
mmetsp:Transcript_16874/g.20608  ORF Transcript_16874/g.20608 Transcript_16874/m.20608 type:complete len:127 (-) Transcript_16874:66-446(-)